MPNHHYDIITLSLKSPTIINLISTLSIPSLPLSSSPDRHHHHHYHHYHLHHHHLIIITIIIIVMNYTLIITWSVQEAQSSILTLTIQKWYISGSCSRSTLSYGPHYVSCLCLFSLVHLVSSLLSVLGGETWTTNSIQFYFIQVHF